MSKIYLNSIKFNRSLVDGPGVRTVVFFQGCDLHCPGCQNRSTWDVSKGTEVETSELAVLLKKESFNRKVTLPDFDIAVYTGHPIEDGPEELLQKIKYIKTGPFIKELRTTVKPYVGSENQEFRRVDHETEMQ